MKDISKCFLMGRTLREMHIYIYIEGSLLDPIHTSKLIRNSPIRVIAIRIGFSGEELLYLALQICSSIIQSAPAPCQTQVSVKHVMALKNLHVVSERKLYHVST